MFINVLIGLLVIPSVWIIIIFLITCSWLMQRIINKMALMCQSVHIVHVPWGILTITLLTYVAGFIDYKAVVVMALFYFVSYPGMWWANYKFTSRLREIFKQKQVTHETVGIIIWADEIRWVWRVRRFWRKLFWGGLNEEIIDRIVDNLSRNGRNDHIKITTRNN